MSTPPFALSHNALDNRETAIGLEGRGGRRKAGTDTLVQMLVALAFLADCACSRSRPLRRLILWILTPAEAFARNFVIGEAQAAGAITVLPAPMSAGDSVADAMRLAACFRALALAVQQLPMPPARFAPG